MFATCLYKIIKIMFLLIKLLLFNIKNSLLLEKPNLRFWYILSFAIGILFCFFTPETYRIINILIIILLSLILVFFYLYSNQYKILTKILLHFSIMFLIGYSVAFHKCINIKCYKKWSQNYTACRLYRMGWV